MHSLRARDKFLLPNKKEKGSIYQNVGRHGEDFRIREVACGIEVRVVGGDDHEHAGPDLRPGHAAAAIVHCVSSTVLKAGRLAIHAGCPGFTLRRLTDCPPLDAASRLMWLERLLNDFTTRPVPSFDLCARSARE